MADPHRRLDKLGGISFIASGALFLANSALELTIGPPPANGAEVLSWAASRKILMSFVSEILFFATMLLIPAIWVLYGRLTRRHPLKAIVVCGSMAATIPILCMALIVHARLVFPVFQLHVHTADVAELVVAIYYGGIHAVLLIMAGATFVLSLAMWLDDRALALLGFATTAFDLLSAYPDAIGPALTAISGVFFALWFVAIGVWLLRTESRNSCEPLSA